MCGFVGFVALGNGAYCDDANLVRAGDAIAHRGPDDAGVWLADDARAGLSFRRLAILDVSRHGHQPMVCADGRYVLVYNGEIYNFKALRAQLDEEAPHVWRGHGDSEVLLELIRRHGVAAALARLDGMFAFAVWDTRERTLHLARDRFGEKPLYYGFSDGAFVFGSELKALKALPGFKSELNREALALFMRTRYIPGARTIYRAYHKLQAGQTLLLKAGEVHLHRYWDLEAEAARAIASPFAGTRREALDEVGRLFAVSTARRLEADVPLGVFLSGGIDSSLTTAYAAHALSAPLNTYTIGFEDQHFNEAPYARKVAEHFGTHHTEIMVNPRDALEVVERLPSMYDEPFADPSQIPTAVLCAQVGKHVRVALAGDGGDELFCGYGRYVSQIKRWSRAQGRGAGIAALLAAKVAASLPVGLLDALDGLRGKPGKLGRKIFARLQERSQDGAEDFFLYASAFWRDGVPVVGFERTRRAPFGVAALHVPGATDVQRFQVLDALMYLPDDVLVKTDRAAMAASLEVRTPFLNVDLARLAWSLPPAMMDPGIHGLKAMLKDLLARHMPRNLFERPKMGFDVPLRAWLRGDLKAWGDDLVLSPCALARDYLDMARIQKRWQDHQRGLNAEGDMWPALMVLAWMRSY